MEIVHLGARSKTTVHFIYERWLLLGNEWHLLDTVVRLTPTPDALPPLPSALDAVRLEYAQWGRERKLVRAVDDHGFWIGGDLRPPVE